MIAGYLHKAKAKVTKDQKVQEKAKAYCVTIVAKQDTWQKIADFPKEKGKVMGKM